MTTTTEYFIKLDENKINGERQLLGTPPIKILKCLKPSYHQIGLVFDLDDSTHYTSTVKCFRVYKRGEDSFDFLSGYEMVFVGYVENKPYNLDLAVYLERKK